MLLPCTAKFGWQQSLLLPAKFGKDLAQSTLSPSTAEFCGEQILLLPAKFGGDLAQHVPNHGYNRVHYG